jgi:ribonuclease P protein component
LSEFLGSKTPAGLLQTGEASFGRDKRLISGAEFSTMRESGSSHPGKLMLLSTLPAPDGRCRLGVVVGRKYDNDAVERNRAKRLLREAFRLVSSSLPPLWIVLVARRSLHGRKAPRVQAELLQLLRNAGHLPS